MTTGFDVFRQWLPRRFRAKTESYQPASQTVAVAEADVETEKTEKTMTLPAEGTVRVVDQRVIVTNPEPGGSFATMMIPEHPYVRITVDGKTAAGVTILTSTSRIEVECDATDATMSYSFRVSHDALEVVMQVVVTTGERWRLLDAQPIRMLRPQFERIPVYPAPLQIHDVLQALGDTGFIGDIDSEALAKLCQTRVSAERVVLRGMRPRLTVPPRFDELDLPREPDPLSRKMQLSTVEAGTTIAIYRPGEPGIPGKDVHGREIGVKTAIVLPQLGDGVEDIQGNIVATRNGRVIFSKRRIDVVPELVLDHDVDPHQGFVRFDGSVVIKGSVLDGSEIKASGSVTIYGNVMGAIVHGTDGIIVHGNITGSKLWAGSTELLYQSLTDRMQSLIEATNQLYRDYIAICKIAKQRGQVPPAHIVAVLMEQRHQQVVADIERLTADYIELWRLDKALASLCEYLGSHWKGARRSELTDSDILRLLRLLSQLEQSLAHRTPFGGANIRAATATSSSLMASGSIIVTGTGVFSSYLQSGESISIQGAVRGGFLVAERAVRVNELGTQYGTESSIKVNQPDGFISAKVRFANTLLDVAGERNRSLFTEYNIRLQNREGLANRESAHRG